jgi:hypothetical protein
MPTTEALRKKISGSMDGEAIQNDITGANGTPPIKRAAITGITPQEQNGLIAPTIVARNIATIGFNPIMRVRNFDAPDTCTATAIGIVITR